MKPHEHGRESLDAASEEVSLRELWQLLVVGWRWPLSGAIAGAIAAGLWLFATPAQYEASGLVQIGRMDPAEQTLLEAPARVVERIRFPAFTEAVLGQLGWSEAGDARRGAVVRASLTASALRNTDLLEVKVRGLSREDASRALTAAVAHLWAGHRALAEPAALARETQLAAAKVQIVETEKLLVQLERDAQRQARARDLVSASVLFEQITTSRLRLAELRSRAAQLDSLHTRGPDPTKLIDAWIPGSPISPKRWPILAAAIFVSGLAGAIAFLFRASVAHKKR